MSALPSLVLLDQNVISQGLRQEAESWNLIRRFNSHGSGSSGLGSTTDLSSAGTKGNSGPLVTVQHKSGGMMNSPLGSSQLTAKGSSTSSMKTNSKQRSVAVVRPMSVQHESLSTPRTLAAPASTESGTMKSCLVKTRKHKSFRQIAFSAMVCSNAGGANRRASSREDDQRPVFRFSIRPPTADWNERKGHQAVGVRTSDRGDQLRSAGEDDVSGSSSSWNSESSDSADDSGSCMSSAGNSKRPSSTMTKPSSSPPGGNRSAVHAATARVASTSATGSPGRSGSSSLSKSAKLSATFGMNIKEQLRDLRIIVGDEVIIPPYSRSSFLPPSQKLLISHHLPLIIDTRWNGINYN